MSFRLAICCRQRCRPIHAPLLRRVALDLVRLELRLSAVSLDVHLVEAVEMAQANAKFLRHAGSTDVISFDYRDADDAPATLHGEILICVDEAVRQAKCFRTTWQSEIIRYLVHGVLHLRGFDDLEPAKRRMMKREENRLLRVLRRRHGPAPLGEESAPPASTRIVARRSKARPQRKPRHP